VKVSWNTFWAYPYEKINSATNSSVFFILFIVFVKI
jgi:hypothetical protein